MAKLLDIILVNALHPEKQVRHPPIRKINGGTMTPEQENLFGFACPECGQGMVRDTTIEKHPTKIKGHPFTVNNAIVGICDRCMARSFAPEETERWEKEYQEWYHSQIVALTGHLSEAVHLLETEVQELRQRVNQPPADVDKANQPTDINEKTRATVEELQDMLEKITRLVTNQKPMTDETPEDFRRRMESHPYVAEAKAALTKVKVRFP